MYLKEIKILGFKSFADKTTINLDDKITCIVGPNGSGKSNIVDAVKWVLGEQSVKSLRGSNTMSDVIFSGSKNRKPLNLGSVSLIFDNSDSYIKIPYTEIEVTRKVYRSGENEYFLNNEKCRLKDILDIFLDSGMGKYAFNIISQGEINKIISDSPLERRIIFEEAAGVLKYKKRKEDALRKLEKTNENLNRVKDITLELETQIEPLKEQSIKAKEYIKAKEELENIEVALIVFDLEQLNYTYQEGKQKIDELENQIIKLGTKITSDDIELENKKNILNQTNEKIVALNQRFLELTKEEEKINGERNIIKERSKYSSEDIRVHENISNLNEQKLILNNKILSFKTDTEILINRLKEINETINKETNLTQVIINEKNQINNDLAEKQREINNIEFKIKSLTDYINDGGNTSIGVKKVLNNPKLTGIHNTISKIIDIESNYVLALEIALGGAKDYLVVDSPSDAKACINYLKENNLGRVTFFPLDVIKERNLDDYTLNQIKNQLGFIDVLSNLTRFEEQYKNIIKNQLGNVILVDNIDNANKISKIINNKYKIVTLTGEVINVGGSITGGSTKNNRSIISERYELNNITQSQKRLLIEINELQEKLKIISEQQQQKQENIIRIEKEKFILEEQINTKNQTYEQLKQQYEKQELELKSLQALSNNSLIGEEEKITNKYYEILNNKDLLVKEISVINKEKEKMLNEIEDYQASYRHNNSIIRDIDTTLKDLEINNSKYSIKIDNLLNILSETYSMTFEKAKSNYILDIDENIARRQVNNCRSQLKNIGIVNIGAVEEYERINKRYEFLSKQSDDLKQAITMLIKIIDELDIVMKNEFIKTFKEIEIEFNKVFKDLFNGGEARLKLTDESNILETGIDVIVTPPGKKVSAISLLSGGEKTLTAISLLFSILNIKNIPFCLFDEVEAALDEANVDRVGNYFKKYIGKTQLIIITHKKKTMEYANTLYGITMQEQGVSKLVSVKLV